MIPSANPGAGFYALVAGIRGQQAAEREWSRAAGDIFTFLKARKIEATPEQVRDYLDSEFGRFAAHDLVTGKQPVARQLEFRPARFLKHFDQVKRRAGAPA